MRDKKKIFALVLFILMGFFMFTFANPSDGIDELTTPIDETEKDTPKPVVEETPIQVNNTANQVVAVIDNAPVITVNPKEVKILRGTDYNVNIGVTIADDKDTDLKPTISMTSTVNAKVGTYTITYTVTDSGNNTSTATRTIKVLEPTGDEDNDHYTNEEELANNSNFDDAKIVPEYDYAPSIDFSSCPTSMTVYDDEIDFSECATATDEYYGTTGVDLVINSNIDSTTFGSYNVTFTATDNLGNQTDDELLFKVVKRELTVIVNNKSSVYGSNLETLDYTITTGTENTTSPAGINVSSTVKATSEVGSYPITGTYTNTNYDVTFVDGTYTISAKTLTDDDLSEVTFDDASSTYDGKEHSLAITGTLPSGVTVSYSNNNSLTNVGNAVVTATFTGSGNYTGTVTKTATLAVTAKSVAAVWGTTTFTYNGSSQVPTASFTDVNKVSQNLTVSGAETNAGTYTATASLSDTNYTLTNTTQEYTIGAKALINDDLSEVTFDDASSVYDGNEHSLAIAGTLPSGVTVSYSNNNSLTNVGNAVVTATFTGSGNYTGTVTKTATLAVTAKSVAAVWGTTTFTYNGSSQVPTASFTDVNKVSQNLTVSGAETNAGTYTATASLSDTNYTLTNTTQEYTIGAKTVVISDLSGVTFEDASSVYDGNEHSLAIDGTLPSGVTVSYSNNNSLTNVGNAVVTATFTGSGNYTGTVTKTATLAVTAKSVVAVWGTTTFTYNGSSQVSTASFTDVNKVSQNLIVSGAQTNAGTYTATANLTDTNYTLTNSTISFTIEIKTLTDDDLAGVTFADASSVYDGNEHSLAIDGTLPSGVAVDYINNGLNNVGSKLVTAIFTGSGNYTGTITKTATLAVTTKSVAAVWGTTTFTYNGSSQVPTASFTDVNKVSRNLTVSGAQTNVGTYTTTASLSDTNYTLTNTTISFTIDIKTLTDDDLVGVTFADASSVYDGNEHSLAITGTLPSGVAVDYINNGLNNVGSKLVTAIFTGSGNYTGTITKTATLAVTAKSVAAVWGTTTFTYNGSSQVPTASFTDINKVSQNLTVSGTETNVGTYTATASLSDTNYTLTNAKQQYTISAKTVVSSDLSGVTFEDASSVYDGNAHSLAIVGTLPSGVTVSYSNNNSLTNVGNAVVTATFTGSGNYTGTVTKTAALAVTAKSVAVVWGTTTFTYNGSSQVPTASFTDINGISQNLTVSGAQTNAGTYTALASLSDINYTLTNKTVVFTINKAVPLVPSIGTLTADERQHLNDIVLPTGFTFEDNTNPILVIGNLNTNLVYTPSDTTNYATVILPVTITVNQKYFDVVFYDYDRTTELRAEEVERGHDATAPVNPTRTNYTFNGWSTSYTNVTSDLNIYATYTANQTGIRIAVNPNVQFQFQKDSSPVITDLIKVYKVYADGREEETTDYNAPIDTASVTTIDKILTITQGSFVDTSIRYSIINEVAYQTKFEVVFNGLDVNSYRATISNECLHDCDSFYKTYEKPIYHNFLEIIEHYDEYISVSSVVLNYTNGDTQAIHISDSVRWTHANLASIYNPVYIGTKEVTVCTKFRKDGSCKESHKETVNIMDSTYVADTIAITYARTGYGTYTIIFKYNSITNTFSAIDEVKVA